MPLRAARFTLLVSFDPDERYELEEDEPLPPVTLNDIKAWADSSLRVDVDDDQDPEIGYGSVQVLIENATELTPAQVKAIYADEQDADEILATKTYVVIEATGSSILDVWHADSHDEAVTLAVDLAKQEGHIPENDFDAEYALRQDIARQGWYQCDNITVTVRQAL